MLIANDADAKRCHMLVHQMKRLQSPCLLVSNYDATQYPNMYYPKSDVRSYCRNVRRSTHFDVRLDFS